MRFAPAAAIALLVAAGCVAGPADDAGPLPPRDPLLLDADHPSLAWTGAVGERGEACAPESCRTHVFRVAPGGSERLLTVIVKWPHEAAQLGLDGSDPSFQFDLWGPGDEPLGEGRLGWLASVRTVPTPAAGEYELRVWGTRSGGAYEAGAILSPVHPSPAPPVDLLPDLVTMPITGLAIEYPDGPPFNTITGPLWGPAATAMGVRGCGADEWAEEEARRCLRFSNGISNLGAGAVEVRLPLQDAAAGAAGQPQFLQRIHATDGSFRDVAAGPAAFHAVHGHYHFEAFAQTVLYAYDLEAGARGDEVVVGEKLGYCFIDVGVHAVDHAPTAEPRYMVDGCLVPAAEQAVVSGLQPGWFDLYWSDLSHQYIEVTGVPDGVYELESVANVEGRILETDLANNAASVLFRLTGDVVEPLGAPPDARPA